MDPIEWLSDDECLTEVYECVEDPLDAQTTASESKPPTKLNAKIVKPSGNYQKRPPPIKYRSRPEQLKVLFRTVDTATCFRTFLRNKEEWKRLTLKLNAMGPPVRSMQNWKKIWSDKKWRTIQNRRASKTKPSLPNELIPILEHQRLAPEPMEIASIKVEALPTEPDDGGNNCERDAVNESEKRSRESSHFEQTVIELLTDMRDEKRKQTAMMEQTAKLQRDLVKIKLEKLKLYRESAERERMEHIRKWNHSGWLIEDTISQTD